MHVLNVPKRRALAGVGAVVATTTLMLGSMTGAASAQQVAPATSPMMSGTAVPAMALSSEWPVLQLGAPSPGALVSSGSFIISGSAFDPSATQGSGISRVDLFLGPRDEGGTFLGSVVPGQAPVPGLDPGSTAAQDSFQIAVTMPSTDLGTKDFIAYAYSAVNDDVTTVSMPINLGVQPTPMATPAATPVAEVEHIHGSAGTTTGAAAAANEGFSLANPSPNDVLDRGDYVVSGATGSAIDRVEFFLDDRDSGGLSLGSTVPANGTFTATVTIPSNTNGGHNFTAYAYSNATGHETRVSVPVFVGTAPTPTPRPS